MVKIVSMRKAYTFIDEETFIGGLAWNAYTFIDEETLVAWYVVSTMPGLMATEEFQFVFKTRGLKSTVTVDLRLPLNQSVEEFAECLMKEHNLPCFVEKDLKEQLGKYVDDKRYRLLDESAERALDRVKEGEVDIGQLVDKWTNSFTQEVAEFTRPEPVTNELVFSEVYHALIHSPALETLLNFEHRYALAMRHITEERDRDLARLEQRQCLEMEGAVHNLGVTHTDEQINQLAQRHFEKMQLIESKWASELSGLQDSQKREYVDWVMCVHADTQAMQETPSYIQQMQCLPSGVPCDNECGSGTAHVPRKEESFTVHLGAQLKTMHNLRLIGADILDLCRHRPQNVGGVTMPQPERLQTAMSLYSNNLCALILLVDNRLNSYTGIKREFAKVCEQSTDFHFPSLEQQFERIEEDISTANEWTAQRKLSEEGDKISVRSGGSSSSEKDDKNVRLSTGDFYITHHSNLAEVHVVCHLVVDESVRTVTADISSRHPVLLGYRNVLKACFRYDIRTITLPLLLVHEMSEEMTIPWCLKRVELVFKCVKGFMMELGTWAGQQSRTIQFIVPSGLSEETFAAINSMLPSIFRMSNPVMSS